MERRTVDNRLKCEPSWQEQEFIILMASAAVSLVAIALAVTLVIIMKEPSSTISGHKSEAEPVDQTSGNHP
ncbi:hypothetical protein BDW66DRAFT_128826 [Aspergillus desertorum]